MNVSGISSMGGYGVGGASAYQGVQGAQASQGNASVTPLSSGDEASKSTLNLKKSGSTEDNLQRSFQAAQSILQEDPMALQRMHDVTMKSIQDFKTGAIDGNINRVDAGLSMNGLNINKLSDGSFEARYAISSVQTESFNFRLDSVSQSSGYGGDGNRLVIGDTKGESISIEYSSSKVFESVGFSSQSGTIKSPTDEAIEILEALMKILMMLLVLQKMMEIFK